jgi:regulator of protease activity HflC (stomatin/prohibitin superfamily)
MMALCHHGVSPAHAVAGAVENELAAERESSCIVRQGISEQLLKWKGIEATVEIAKSANAKVIVVGSGKDGLPIILGSQ